MLAAIRLAGKSPLRNAGPPARVPHPPRLAQCGTKAAATGPAHLAVGTGIVMSSMSKRPRLNAFQLPFRTGSDDEIGGTVCGTKALFEIDGGSRFEANVDGD